MVPLAPAKWWRKKAVAAGLYSHVNGDIVVDCCYRLVVGVGQNGLGCFGMGIPWKDGVTGGLSILDAA